MKVFEFIQDMDHFRPWTTEDGSLGRISDSVAAGSPVAAEWTVPRGHVRKIGGLREGDFPYWVDPLFSTRARQGLEDLLDPYGEWLPVVTMGGGEFFVYNVTTVIDCLDQERSQLARTTSGRVYGARQLAFDAAEIGDRCCFRVPEGVTLSFYMLGDVVERVEELGLQGLAPLEIWDSELGPRRLGLI